MERVAPHWWELTLPVLHLIGADRNNPKVLMMPKQPLC